MNTRLSDEQKRSLLHDGYVIIRNAVPLAQSQRVRELIEAQLITDEGEKSFLGLRLTR